jgi:hypothetical protein
MAVPSISAGKTPGASSHATPPKKPNQSAAAEFAKHNKPVSNHNKPDTAGPPKNQTSDKLGLHPSNKREGVSPDATHASKGLGSYAQPMAAPKGGSQEQSPSPSTTNRLVDGPVPLSHDSGPKETQPSKG